MPPTARFFDDEGFLRTVIAEKSPARSAAEAHAAVRLAGGGRRSRILDAGCGNGRHAMPLAHAGHRVVGLDSSAVLLAGARRAARSRPWPHLVQGSYARLAFEPASFDAVLCLGTALGYLGDKGDAAALQEFRRVLTPKGRLVIETLHRDEIGARIGEHEERTLTRGATLRFERSFDLAASRMRETQRLYDGGADSAPRTYEVRVYGERELCRMLEAAGFEVIGRHASLAGGGEPSPVTPLVLVAAPACR
jgi:SAM-dependent methyltransferase